MVRINFNRLRFLVIDDNAHMRRIMRSLLHGFDTREVYEAEDGAAVRPVDGTAAGPLALEVAVHGRAAQVGPVYGPARKKADRSALLARLYW